MQDEFIWKNVFRRVGFICLTDSELVSPTPKNADVSFVVNDFVTDFVSSFLTSGRNSHLLHSYDKRVMENQSLLFRE